MSPIGISDHRLTEEEEYQVPRAVEASSPAEEEREEGAASQPRRDLRTSPGAAPEEAVMEAELVGRSADEAQVRSTMSTRREEAPGEHHPVIVRNISLMSTFILTFKNGFNLVLWFCLTRSEVPRQKR